MKLKKIIFFATLLFQHTIKGGLPDYFQNFFGKIRSYLSSYSKRNTFNSITDNRKALNAIADKCIEEEKEFLKKLHDKKFVIDILNSDKDDVKKRLLYFATIPDENGDTLLHIAAEKNYLEIAKKLLQDNTFLNVFQIDKPDYFGKTPLMRAAQQGHTAMVELLLDKGADCNISDDVKGSVLRLAVIGNHEQTAQLLLKRGASQQKFLGDPLLFDARTSTMAKLLIAAGADVNERSELAQYTYLHNIPVTYIRHGCSLYDIISLTNELLQSGANPCAQNTCGDTFIHKTVGYQSKQRRQLTKIFLYCLWNHSPEQFKKILHMKNNSGRTPHGVALLSNQPAEFAEFLEKCEKEDHEIIEELRAIELNYLGTQNRQNTKI